MADQAPGDPHAHPGTGSELPRAIGKPATNALHLAGVYRLEQVARHSERELLALHGVGPKAMRLLKEVLAEQGLTFASAPDERR